MRISLVMPTINVTEELQLFLESLKNQTYKNFELIVVDQNSDDRVSEILSLYYKFINIIYIKSDVVGISKNRNTGLLNITGSIVGFPDDDCEYDNDTLMKVITYFKENKTKKIYSCRTLERGKSYGTGVMNENDSDITISNAENTVKSITFFVNYSLDEIEFFDEKLGVGSMFGSGEETDYVLKLLHRGFEGNYFSNDIIYHPAKKGNYEDLDRAKKYSLGYGALVKKEVVLRKNRKYIFKFLKKIIRNIGGLFLSKHKKYHLTVIKYRIIGFKNYRKH